MTSSKYLDILFGEKNGKKIIEEIKIDKTKEKENNELNE
jgi:hypothetical protein